MFTCKHFFLLNFHCLTYSALDVQHLFCHLKIRGFWGLKYKFDLALRLYGLYGLWSKILGDGVEGVITVKTTLVPAMLTRPEKCYTATVPTSARSEKKMPQNMLYCNSILRVEWCVWGQDWALEASWWEVGIHVQRCTNANTTTILPL